uniref:Uncharacterized protein n=1 Tax=Panagrolaimus superbus TaxID=310955 RepID=A0A914YJC5_9BILA
MMIIYSYFLLTIFLMDIPESQGSNFTCFHSEGYFEQYNISQEIIPCPSRTCLMLRTYCDNYWAATCFDPSRPMAIFEDFEMAKKVYETRTHWILSRCPGFKENCNDVYVHYRYSHLRDFPKPITSLDNLIWTNLNLPKPKYLMNS